MILRFSALGDVAMTVPVISSLARRYPNVRFTMVSRAGMRPLFQGLAPNVGFMEADIKGEYRGLRGLNALFRRLIAKQPTAIADLHGVLRSDYLRLRFSLAMYKVAHIDKHRAGKRALAKFPDKKLVRQNTSFQNYAEVFAKLGYPVEVTFTSIFQSGKGDLSRLPSCFGHKAETWIGIAPFAAHAGKIYPQELMERVIAMLVERHPECRIFLFGGGNTEQAVFNLWCLQHKQLVSVPDHIRGLRKELILMSHLDVMLSMDSANMHLASLTGTPVVSVWGATHPFAGFMGWGQSEANAVQSDMPCRPCSVYGNRRCRYDDYPCLRNIAPATIADKIESVLTAKQNT